MSAGGRRGRYGAPPSPLGELRELIREQHAERLATPEKLPGETRKRAPAPSGHKNPEQASGGALRGAARPLNSDGRQE